MFSPYQLDARQPTFDWNQSQYSPQAGQTISLKKVSSMTADRNEFNPGGYQFDRAYSECAEQYFPPPVESSLR